MATENFNLERVPSDPFAAKRVLDHNFEKLDALQGVAVADSAAGDVAGVVADFNELPASLRAAGLIATA